MVQRPLSIRLGEASSVRCQPRSYVNVIVSPSVVVRDELHGGHVLLVERVVQREGEVIDLLAQHVAPPPIRATDPSTEGSGMGT